MAKRTQINEHDSLYFLDKLNKMLFLAKEATKAHLKIMKLLQDLTPQLSQPFDVYEVLTNQWFIKEEYEIFIKKWILTERTSNDQIKEMFKDKQKLDILLGDLPEYTSKEKGIDAFRELLDKQAKTLEQLGEKVGKIKELLEVKRKRNEQSSINK